MKKKRDVVISINPYHSEIKVNEDNSFTLTFFDNVGGDYTRKKVVNINFKGWWLRFLAASLWKVIEHRKSQLLGDENALRGGQ